MSSTKRKSSSRKSSKRKSPVRRSSKKFEIQSTEELKYLLDINWVKKNTRDVNKLKVTLKKDKIKGSGLFATKPIKSGETIAYYKMIVYPESDSGPFDDMYLFSVYRKDGRNANGKCGNLYKGSLPQPKRNIPYWAYFSNEPSGTQTSNSFIDTNDEENHKNGPIRIGDTIVYSLIADRDIKAGEEIIWCYGPNYNRSYKANCPN